MYVMRIFALLGAAALILGCTGLFSVLSYIVNQRMREFAVRVALGAPRSMLARLVILGGLEMTLAGTAIGAGLGIWSGFLLWNLLYGMYPADAGALVIAEGILLLATFCVSAIPAIRATRADPIEILRAN
jgi:ABC-type antimicrobial peptide transport system permease subunit